MSRQEDAENIRSKEEEEELQEQQRRQEELDCLLSDGIQAFNSGDNSPNTTCASFDAVESEYRNVPFSSNSVNDSYGREALNYIDTTPNNQLKVLYDVRVREVHDLNDELNRFKIEKSEEINSLKRKLTVSEAEIRQLQISLTNIESLLVEKTGIIKDLNENLISKDIQIQKLQTQVEDDQIEISTCKTAITELQFKLANNNPFNASSQNFKSSELQKTHQERILKLETLLEEQTEKNRTLEKDNFHLQEKLKNILQNKNESDQDNNLTIIGLSQQLQTVQQQSKDLFFLGEALKRENDHFKERLKQIGNNVPVIQLEYLKGKDNETIFKHFENLTKLLLDKDIELNTLKHKLKSYDSHMKEFFEYKNLSSNLEINNCGNKDHINQFLFLKNDLTNCHKLLEERNQQIIDLNSINKELQEKIEEMLQQTRNDIQNLSHKYSLPQLEMMSKDLKCAEEKIEELGKYIEINELEKKDLVKQIEQLKLNENLIIEIKTENSHLKDKLMKETDEKNTLKKEFELKINEIKTENLHLKDKLLKEVDEKNAMKKEIEELLYSKIIIEKERDELQCQFKNSKEEIQSLKIEIETITKNLKKEMSKLETELRQFQENENICLKNNEKNVRNLENDLKNCVNKDNVVDSDLFKNCLQAEILKIELKLHEQLQNENLEKVQKIEEKYQKVCLEKNDEINRLKSQEKNYRKQLAFILAQCSEKVIQLENDNEKLNNQYNKILADFEYFKKNLHNVDDKYKEIVKNIATHFQEKELKKIQTMENFTKRIVENQKKCALKIDNFMLNAKKFDTQVKLIEENFNKKIEKKKKGITLKN